VTVSLDRYRSLLDSLPERGPVLEERLVRWAEINSGSGNRPGLEAMTNELEAAFAESVSVRAERIALSSGDALRWTCRPEASCRVLFCGHLDTVYPPDHPFQSCTRLDANTLRGPGVADMKGGLLILLEALRVFEAFADASNVGWEVLITPDEETGSVHSAPLLEEAARRNDIGLVFEPAIQESHDLARERPGSAVYHLLAKGRSAHVGRDFASGRNAIAALATAVGEIHALNRNEGLICNTGFLHGGGPVNVVPDRAQASLNVRARDPDQVESLLEDILMRIGEEFDVGLDLEGGFVRPPKRLTPAIQGLFARVQACAAALGRPLNWRDTGGCCDGNNLAAAGLPNLDNLGPWGGNIHSPEEFVLLDSLVHRAQLAALFLMDWSSNPSHEPCSTRND